jgi:hypothetical protein
MKISFRLSGSAVMFASVVWVVSWLLNSQTENGKRAVFGLTEGNYRAILNPTLLLIVLGLFGLYQVHMSRISNLGLIGFWATGLSLAAWLVGNILEFGLFGLYWLPDVGWIVIIVATIGISLGHVLFGIEFLKAKLLVSWSRSLPIFVGVLSVIGSFITPRIFTFSFGIGWILLGYALWSYKPMLSEQPANQNKE